MAEEVSPETAALRAALDAANRNIEAERSRRMEIEGRLRTETGTRFAAQESAVETALAQSEANAVRLQNDWAALQAEGKFTEAAQLMREMGDTTARIAQLKGQKDWYGQQKQAAAQAAVVDPLANFNQVEREWIAKNPRYTEDPAFTRKVNAAATHAIEFEGLIKDSPEYWRHIEAKVYPERAQPAASLPRQDNQEQTDDSLPAGDVSGGDGDSLEQQHTMNIPIVQPSVNAPVMQIETKAAEAQPRAMGKGGDGMRATAAPPSRRIAEVSNRLARGGRIEPTMKELEVARALYESIEPNATDRSDETIVRWYHALYNSPSHQRTRRRHWVNSEGSAA